MIYYKYTPLLTHYHMMRNFKSKLGTLFWLQRSDCSLSVHRTTVRQQKFSEQVVMLWRPTELSANCKRWYSRNCHRFHMLFINVCALYTNVAWWQNWSVPQSVTFSNSCIATAQLYGLDFSIGFVFTNPFVDLKIFHSRMRSLLKRKSDVTISFSKLSLGLLT